jgi:methylmalonyl-CoA mutase cobalamin-binding subunit
MPSPIRVLTAVPICDGHDSAINTINLEFIRHGIEVIYLGYQRNRVRFDQVHDRALPAEWIV